MDRRVLVCGLAALAASTAAADRDDFTIARRGEAPDCAIVIAADADECIRYAAQELRDYVERLTGVALPVHAVDGQLPLAKAVVLQCDGGAMPSRDAFRLHVEDGRLVVTGGGPSGVLYGVYELLETYGGVGWFASWRTVVPNLDAFGVPQDLDVSQSPAFAMRMTSWFDTKRTQNPAFAARLRLNGSTNVSVGPEGAKYGGVPYRFGQGLGACHTFNHLLPPEVHFKDHPEWYSEVDGVRRSHTSQLCLTNPDVLRLVTSNVLEHIRRDPGATFFGVSQNDWQGYCTCPNCAAVDAEEESHAGTNIRFVNAIAEAVEKEFPNVFIETLAYQYTRKPPKKTKPRHNVVPCLCTIECAFNQPLDGGSDAANAAFLEDIRGWSKLTDNLYIWDYTTNFRNYLHLFPNVHALGPNLRLFRDSGAKYVLEQGDGDGRHGDFAELKAWLIAKLEWNPDQPVEPLIDRFFDGYYGAAAPFVRQYFEKSQALGALPSAGHWGIYSDTDVPNVPDGFLPMATNLWAQALAAVKDDPVLSYNVRMGATSPLYTMATRGPAGYLVWVTSNASRCDTEGAHRMVRELLDCQTASGNRIRWCESKRLNELRTACWDRFLARPEALGPQDTDTVYADMLALGMSKDRGVLVDDPEAIGGRALKLLPTHYAWCFGLNTAAIAYDAGARYRVRVHLRVAKRPGGSGEAFWAGVYDGDRRKSCGQIEPKVEETDEEYRWYDILEWAPEQGQYIWIGPGRFDQAVHAESPAHNGIYIDALEISRANGRNHP